MKYLVVALGLLSVPAMASEPASVFGIEFGKPLTLPECSYQMGGGMKLYDTLQRAECQEPARPDRAAGVTWAPVNFPPDSAPTIAKWTYINAYMLNGIVEGIEFPTAGVSSQDIVLAQLKQKFGPPSTQSSRRAQNAMGATFQVIEAEWHSGTITVSFHGALDQFDKGRVEICRKALCDARRVAGQAVQAGRQGL